ncbi:S-receptor-like serine/threonine-protein kinase [Parasponia andersonii]|uniref:Receptor-like serine/threonine-protein kinase n=1 Tax=Parasponia andersonii TaxID=3476 RepID=A0A2P5B4Q4_PARAD|nr:S-receptor-like serine/threonine-protein kinase [Parasponia andersonii]
MKLLFVLLCFALICFPKSYAIEFIKPNQTLLDNAETLHSTGQETFELGFFSPRNSKNRYVGIWYKNVQDFTVVWVANRENPLADSSGVLTMTPTGNVVLLSNQSGVTIWSSYSSAKNPSLELLGSGNLVVKDGGSGSYAWQSFDHPCDTQIAGMKLGWDFVTGQNWYLTSWNSLQDPSIGNYTYKVDPRLPQVIQRRGNEIVYRSGQWDGVRFGGDPPFVENPAYRPIYVFNQTHAYYTFENIDNSSVTRFWVHPSGSLQQLKWNRGTGDWTPIVFTLRKDECDTYGRCGPNGFCDNNRSPVCYCPTGFVPKVPQDWAGLDSSGGCVLRAKLNCSAREGFQRFSGMKLPYSPDYLVNRSVVSKEDCELICRRNCSCVAYSVSRLTGCAVWFNDLFDIRVYNTGGQNLYLRMAASEFESDKDGKRSVAIISISVVSGFLLLFLVGAYIIRKRTSSSHISQADAINNSNEDEDSAHLVEDADLPSFGLDIIANATNNFSSINKIGEGGFGLVYKGMLPTGQEIAVKRLSKDSGQGIAEFKNEVILISKLQHRNLVRLLGCYIHKEDRMLIYEYMSNKSLDLYIFNQTRGTTVDWQKRFDIIVGIARGLLYLHRDSRLRIIHRDLKASNILLDDEMNPKISDFGLARIFRDDQTRVNTKRVVGTYGYMSPEYAIDGHFSMKSDVFSFGVIILEIVSGKKNRGFDHPDHDLNLLGHAWKLWNDGRPIELVDALLERVPASEVLRCIQVGLLCVQKRPEERPLMSSVLYMLDSDNASLPQPKQPGFYVERVHTETDSSSSWNKTYNSTELTVTTLHGR